MLRVLFADSPVDVTFERGTEGRVIARTPDGEGIEIPTGQSVMDLDIESALPGLNAFVSGSRRAWEKHALVVPGHPGVIADAHVLAGVPTIKGTRVETALIGAFVGGSDYDDETVARIRRAYPRLTEVDIHDALSFEGLTRRAG